MPSAGRVIRRSGTLRRREAEASRDSDASLFPEHTLNLRHVIMAYRITFSIVPSNGDFTPRRSDNRTMVSCRWSPANTVAGSKASGLIASHFVFRRDFSLQSVDAAS
jgi:hypothetical protein